ncbi:MAG TPA: hypothetical protein VMR19_01020 [Candidatus Saccharimonadales bacterium]|nr:hypothetical protein [Candidatus Saccharimonadales bacterium]
MLSNHLIGPLQFGQILRPFATDILLGYRQVRAEINDPKTKPKTKMKID